MRLVNRSVAVVRPREPYIKWATSLDERAEESEAFLRDQLSVYLVPPDPREEQEAAPMESWFRKVFEIELESWHLDTAAWPQQRDLRSFLEWFEVSVSSVVCDLGAGPVEHDVR